MPPRGYKDVWWPGSKTLGTSVVHAPANHGEGDMTGERRSARAGIAGVTALVIGLLVGTGGAAVTALATVPPTPRPPVVPTIPAVGDEDDLRLLVTLGGPQEAAPGADLTYVATATNVGRMPLSSVSIGLISALLAAPTPVQIPPGWTCHQVDVGTSLGIFSTWAPGAVSGGLFCGKAPLSSGESVSVTMTYPGITEGVMVASAGESVLVKAVATGVAAPPMVCEDCKPGASLLTSIVGPLPSASPPAGGHWVLTATTPLRGGPAGSWQNDFETLVVDSTDGRISASWDTSGPPKQQVDSSVSWESPPASVVPGGTWMTVLSVKVPSCSGHGLDKSHDVATLIAHVDWYAAAQDRRHDEWSAGASCNKGKASKSVTWAFPAFHDAGYDFFDIVVEGQGYTEDTWRYSYQWRP